MAEATVESAFLDRRTRPRELKHRDYCVRMIYGPGCYCPGTADVKAFMVLTVAGGEPTLAFPEG